MNRAWVETDLDQAQSKFGGSWLALVDHVGTLTINTADQVREVFAAHQRAEQTVRLHSGQISA